MKKMQSVICLTVVLCLSAVLFAGCGANSSSNAGTTAGKEVGSATSAAAGTSAAQPAKDVSKTIKYLASRNQDHAVIKSINAIVSEFQKQYPNFKLEIESVADRPAYLQKVKTLIASNAMPDWIDVDADAYTLQLAKQGLLANVDDLLKEIGSFDSFNKAALDYQRFEDGSCYLIPLEYNIEMFWYNKELYNKAGITAPPKTFDEFLQDCKALKDKNITAISVGGREKWPLIRWVAYLPFREAGNDYIEKLKKGQASMADPIGMKALNFVQELGTKGYFQEGFANADYDSAKNLFLAGNAATYYIGTWELANFEEKNLPDNLKGKIDYFLLPMTADATTAPNDMWAHSGIGLGISKNSVDDITKEFLKFFIDRYGETALNVGGFFPPVKFELPADASDLSKRAKKDMDNIGKFAYCWDVRLDPVTNELFGNELTALATGAVTPEKFAKEIDDSIKENAPKFFK